MKVELQSLSMEIKIIAWLGLGILFSYFIIDLYLVIFYFYLINFLTKKLLGVII